MWRSMVRLLSPLHYAHNGGLSWAVWQFNLTAKRTCMYVTVTAQQAATAVELFIEEGDSSTNQPDQKRHGVKYVAEYASSSNFYAVPSVASSQGRWK
ncbi:hypothetical protein QBC44DRAFT_382537 [Cladorrhinum sp. PSN332]|nr:hypothetical protein QBC44DRAFT_382537 [Cladorrhinum sp. PSN332]